MSLTPPPTDHEARARRWMEIDPDPTTRAATLAMLASPDHDRLRECFGHRPGFGTAGIRAPIGPGPGCINRLVARQTAAGLGAVLAEQGPARVVVGFDGRHGSRAFAADMAAVLATQGHTAMLFAEECPTPLLAHATVDLGCRAGVMVTASHNPPADNGIKVYGASGAQIVPPVDEQIQRAIAAIEHTCPPAEAEAELRAAGRLQTVPAAQAERYLAAVLALRVQPATGLRCVYTPLHGVGWASIERLFARAGHTLIPVPEQVRPDGDFPTVALPNPEEKGALDLAMALATREGASIILANDPDGDRLAVAVPLPTGGWRRLTGDEVGLLLAERLLAARSAGASGIAPGPRPLVANTIVSCSLLGDIAAAHGAVHVQTLTGFKWLAQAAMDHPGPFVLGYEEALGYCIGEVVRDKDGLCAALVMLDLANEWADRGGLLAALDELAVRYGAFTNAQMSLTLPGRDGAALIQERMAGLRAAPPTSIAGHPVRRFFDVKRSESVDLLTGVRSELSLPRSDVLGFELMGGSRVLIRPSGTEPKLKIYVEARAVLQEGEPVALAWRRSSSAADALLAWADAWLASPAATP